MPPCNPDNAINPDNPMPSDVLDGIVGNPDNAVNPDNAINPDNAVNPMPYDVLVGNPGNPDNAIHADNAVRTAPASRMTFWGGNPDKIMQFC